MNPNQKIRVLIVDDSAVVRKMIMEALNADPEIEVVGTAPDPYVARDKILELNPDVVTLDMEMPRMDGLRFLSILQQHHPVPVIVISSLTTAGSDVAMRALQAGAVDVLAKPTSAYSIGHLAAQLPDRIKGAAASRRVVPSSAAAAAVVDRCVRNWHAKQVILFGSSTGGVEALCELLPQLPDGLPPICIAQHIPAHFSKALAERLHQLCSFEVREAKNGDELHPGLALVAPGDYHMILAWDGTRHCVRLTQSPPLHHCRPAVDALFNSAASSAGSHATAILLTGMGYDGANGMQALKSSGAKTVAQDEASCVVFGMPRAAIKLGVVDHVVSLTKMPRTILATLEDQANELTNRNRRAA